MIRIDLTGLCSIHFKSVSGDDRLAQFSNLPPPNHERQRRLGSDRWLMDMQQRRVFVYHPVYS